MCTSAQAARLPASPCHCCPRATAYRTPHGRAFRLPAEGWRAAWALRFFNPHPPAWCLLPLRRLAGILRNLSSYYYKEPTLLFLVRIAQARARAELTHIAAEAGWSLRGAAG